MHLIQQLFDCICYMTLLLLTFTGDSPLEGKVNQSRAFDVERTVRKSPRKIKKKHHDEDYEDSMY